MVFNEFGEQFPNFSENKNFLSLFYTREVTSVQK